MNKYGKLINPNTLQFERMLPGPIDRIWEYLVDGSKRSLWFAGGPTNLVLNGKMELIFNNSKLSSVYDPTPEKHKKYGDGFASFATIVKFDKPNLLVINWEDGQVTFRLEKQKDGKVKLTLTHEKLQDGKEYRVGTLAGWHTHLDILFDRLSDNEVKRFWHVHMQFENEYSQIIE